MKTLQFPDGRTYTFGEISYSKHLISFIRIARKGTPEDGDMLEFLESGWHIAVQSLMNGGQSRQEAELAMESVPMNPEWLAKLRWAIGLGSDEFGNEGGDHGGAESAGTGSESRRGR